MGGGVRVIAWQATQSVIICAMVVIGALIGCALIMRKANEPAVMRAKAEIEEERLNAGAIRDHKERMASVEYDRAVQNLERDRTINQLEAKRMLREIEAAKPQPEDAKGGDG